MLSWKTASSLRVCLAVVSPALAKNDDQVNKKFATWISAEAKMPKTTIHVLWLLVLILLAFEGVSARHVQPSPNEQKPKPATSTESAKTSLFGAVIDEDEDLVRRLLQQDPALVRVSNEHGTALHFA